MMELSSIDAYFLRDFHRGGAWRSTTVANASSGWKAASAGAAVAYGARSQVPVEPKRQAPRQMAPPGRRIHPGTTYYGVASKSATDAFGSISLIVLSPD